MSIRAKLSTLIQLANIDGEFAGEERQLIYMIGQANKMTKEEIDELVRNPEPLPPVSTMTEDDKFEYLYNIVQLMKIDSQVFLSEIKYCEDLAERLGFNRKIIGDLSTKIFSDPAITSSVESLKKAMRKHQN
jgi:hypothetical protein